MGLLNKIFGIPESEEVPSFNSVIPDNIKNIIMTGNLPVFTTSTIMLGKNEVCHYIDKAICADKEKVKKYRNRRMSNRIRITKWWNINIGDGTVTPDDFNYMKYYKGVLYITNKRIIFSSQDKAIDREIDDLTSFVPYKDAIGLQFGNEMINIILDRPELCCNVITMINQNRI